MGQNQSRDGTASTALAASTASAAVSTAIASTAVDAYIVLRQRPDGSSVREMFVPAWHCGFYRAGSSALTITESCDLPTVGSGKYISIDAESAALLYKALLNHRAAQAAAAAAAPVLTKYVEGGGFFKL
jgi:hypothetical protein